MTPEEVAASDAPVLVLAVGLCYASICTTIEDDDTAVTSANGIIGPAGTRMGWHVSDDATFADGTPNPSPCPHVEGRRHVLLEC